MANREELLQSIHQGMKLDKSFFLKIYSYEISFPGFAAEAIKALEDAGCSKAQEYYNAIIGEYQNKRDEELKPVARAIRQKWEEDWKRLQKQEVKENRNTNGDWHRFKGFPPI